MGEQGRHLAGADLTTPAVVLKLDPNVMHHGGLGVIRSLGRIGVPVYGVHEGPLAPAANSRYLRGRAFWSPGAGDADQIADGLAALSDRIGQRAVLLPTDDAGAIFLAEHGAALRPRFIFPDPPRDLPRQVAGKFSLHELCRELGVPSPAAAVVDPAGPASAAAAREFAARAGYPLIAKLTTPWASSLRSTSILTTPAELDAALGACAHEGAGLMLQEYIPGGRDTDWFFHGYCDATSDCRPAFTGVKERSYPAHAGLTSLGRAEPNPALRDQVTQLLSKLGYQGLLDLDLRLDRRDGHYKLLDFNPRLGAQFRLFATAGGLDLATAAYLDLTGQPVPADDPATEQAAGRRFIVENYDPLSAAGYWRRGELSPARWLSSLRGISEAAWFARDDLAPFGLMCLRMGWRLAAGGRRRPATAGFRYSPGRAAPAGAKPARTTTLSPITTKAPMTKEARS
jgi:predicted ATP-grasp superfamily ATP-dependent carboligase